ncbi:MAG: hypothetical protein JWO46_466 [Nocardioidaceae bacterium]|nr:hypothetical protein [Nocardioidaceae bacterium]
MILDAYDEPVRALGWVPVEGRGSLPFALLQGESLVACAAWALGEAEVDLVDVDSGWDAVRHAGRPVVVHDPLCPGTPPEFVAAAVAETLASDRVVVGARPVTDTLKQVEGDPARIGATVDRDLLVQVVSPLVLPARVVAALAEPPDTTDLVSLVAELRTTEQVSLLDAPVSARRIQDEDDLPVLEALIARGATGP